MRIIKKVRDRRRERRERILDAIENRREMNHEERVEAMRLAKSLTKELNKNNRIEIEGNGEPLNMNAGSVRAIIALWVCLGFLIVTMLFLFLYLPPVSIAFEIWKYLGAIVSIIIGSYFYTRFKAKV